MRLASSGVAQGAQIKIGRWVGLWLAVLLVSTLAVPLVAARGSEQAIDCTVYLWTVLLASGLFLAGISIVTACRNRGQTPLLAHYLAMAALILLMLAAVPALVTGFQMLEGR
jgi:hypothetical protein